MQAFVIRPFGTKKDIDFEEVHARLIGPALLEIGAAGGTTASIFEAGNIRQDMFQLLLLADLVIADISIHNANVFYELGIRHALRTRQTFLLRARVTRPKEEQGVEDDVPFDLKTDRYLEYDPAEPALTLPQLIQGLRETNVSQRTDSPVFGNLPLLEEPDRSKLLPVPPDFALDVECAARTKDVGRLGLLGMEVARLPWEIGGLRLIGREQFQLAAWKAAGNTWERIRSRDPEDLEANLRLGTAEQRLGNLVVSDARLRSVLACEGAERHEKAEALALLGRNEKARGRSGWSELAPSDRRQRALRAGSFPSARDYYQRAYELDLNHYFSGLNALSLSVLLLETIALEPGTWTEGFDTEDQATADQTKITTARDRLVAAVGMALDVQRSKVREGARDIWLELSCADYAFLTARRDGAVAGAYQRALRDASEHHVLSARSQLALFHELGLRSERVSACLDVFPAVTASAAEDLRMAVIFSGHRLDTPDRSLRFPAAAEAKARTAIRAEVQTILQALPGPVLGIAGGANGGDILFHEVCRHELDIPTEILLTLPPGPFAAESVSDAGPGWTARFDRLLEEDPGRVKVLGVSKDLPSWIKVPVNYDVWQRTNLWLLQEAEASCARHVSLLALWDGQTGSRSGGTQHMVELADQHNIPVRIISTASFLTQTAL
ncbi:MAG: hypothetical protein H7039_12410 [Bryobacteraceae bacterium]|nr:hypothetical protein [Bryobacteraceae bacterium]